MNDGRRWQVHTVLTVTAALVRERDWTPRPADPGKAAELEGTGAWTADLVHLLLTERGDEAEAMIRGQDAARASSAWKRLEARDNLTEADAELRSRVREMKTNGGVPADLIGYVSQVIIADRNGQKRYAAKDRWARLSGSEWQGKPGELLRGLHLEVVNDVPLKPQVAENGKRFQSHIYTLADKDGNAFKWLKGTACLIQGQRVLLSSAKVKRHTVAAPGDGAAEIKVTEIHYVRVKEKRNG